MWDPFAVPPPPPAGGAGGLGGQNPSTASALAPGGESMLSNGLSGIFHTLKRPFTTTAGPANVSSVRQGDVIPGINTNQPGDDNEAANIDQNGSGNSSTLTQIDLLDLGGSNFAKVMQTGDDNLSTITQDGLDNSATVTQTGDTNQSVISQTGTGNAATVTQGM